MELILEHTVQYLSHRLGFMMLLKWQVTRIYLLLLWSGFKQYLYVSNMSEFPLIWVARGPRGLYAEDLQGMSELGGLRGLEGRSAGAGIMHSAERRPSAHRRERAQWPQSGGQQWSAPPSSTPSVLFLHDKEGRGNRQWLSSTRPTALFERSGRGGGGFAESLNVTLIDRYLCEPALQPVVVGSLLHSTNRDDFSMPPVKMRYVIAVLTMRQVCFRSRTLLWSSEMCRAQLQDLDDSCSVGALDGV